MGKLIQLDEISYTNTTISSVIDASIPEVWSKLVEDYVKAKRVMEQFTVEIPELVRKPGDKIYINKRSEIALGDLTENVALEGNEKKLGLTTVAFTPAEKGGAVRFSTQAQSKSIVDLRKEARYVLGDAAAQKIDSDIYAAMKAGTTEICWGGDATGSGDIDAADKITPALVSKVRYRAEEKKIPKFNTKDPTTPGTANKGYYVMILSPAQIYDLTQHADYVKAAVQAATIVGGDAVGPMFKGFQAYWNGVLIYDSTNVPQDDNGYATTIHKGHLIGPRALGRAVGLFNQGPGFIWNEKDFDYGRAIGIALRWYDHCKVLNSDRIVGVYTAASSLSC